MKRRRLRLPPQLDEKIARAIAAAAHVQRDGGPGALAQPADAIGGAIGERIRDALAAAATVAQDIIDKTPLDRRNWALGQFAAHATNPLLPIDVRLAALKLFCEVQANQWDKQLEAFPPPPTGFLLPGAPSDAVAAAQRAADRTAAPGAVEQVAAAAAAGVL